MRDLTIADQALPSFPGAARAARSALRRASLAYVEPLPDTAARIAAHHRGAGGSHDGPGHVLPVGAKTALSLVLQAARETGRDLVLLTPTYSGLRRIGASLGPVREIAMRGDYGLDAPAWHMLEAAVAQRPSVVVLVNPDNPTGRAWSEVELDRLDAIVADADGVVVSDEVHRDLVWRETATSFAGAGRAARWIAIGSLAKAFNLGAIPFGWTLESDDDLHDRVERAMRRTGLHPSSLVGEAVAAACLSRSGERWLARRRARLATLVARACRVLDATCEVEQPDAGFLVWARSRERGEDLAARLHDAGVLTMSGVRFGAPRDAVRINVAMPAATLDATLHVMSRALGRAS